MRVIADMLLLLIAIVPWAGGLRATAQTEASSPGAESQVKTQMAQEEEHLRSYLASHEDAIDARYLLGYTLFRENKPKDSLAEYTRAAALREPTAKDLQTVALDYVLLGDYADADHWMTRSVAGQSQSAEAWYELGRIKYSESRMTEALDCFRKTLAIDPHHAKAENNLGLTLEGLNRTDEAVAAYRTAIAWQKDAEHPSEQPLLNLAIVLTERQQLPEALSLAREADRIAPRDPRVCEQLGRIYARTGDLDQAQAALERASALDPQKAAIHFELAQVYRKQGKAELAKAESERVAQLSGTRSTPER